jgi:alpha-D-xyloside xylohydrolase
MDIGGFSVEARFQNPNASDLEEWREMQTRWLQFGTFTPIFRVHGEFPFREMWNIAPENHPAYQAMLASDKLRYRLMPYIYSLAGLTWLNDYTIMRAMVMDFGYDIKVRDLKYQFMFGPAIMVNPVCEYKARTREVYLPEGMGWYDLFTGKYFEGGQSIVADAPYGHIPLYFKEGSIVPIGPEIQYTTQKPADTLTLLVFKGKDATFTLYEDENVNYNYEKGAYSLIPFSYDEKSGSFTIGSRKGVFEGMLRKRVFNIVQISPKTPEKLNFDGKPDKQVVYTGNEIKIKL